MNNEQDRASDKTPAQWAIKKACDLLNEVWPDHFHPDYHAGHAAVITIARHLEATNDVPKKVLKLLEDGRIQSAIAALKILIVEETVDPLWQEAVERVAARNPHYGEHIRAEASCWGPQIQHEHEALKRGVEIGKAAK